MRPKWCGMAACMYSTTSILMIYKATFFFSSTHKPHTQHLHCIPTTWILFRTIFAPLYLSRKKVIARTYPPVHPSYLYYPPIHSTHIIFLYPKMVTLMVILHLYLSTKLNKKKNKHAQYCIQELKDDILLYYFLFFYTILSILNISLITII